MKASDNPTRLKICAHINQVRQFLGYVLTETWKRYTDHDKTKLQEPEFSIFDKHFAALQSCECGTPEYLVNLEKVEAATSHHYAHNRHHPNHFQNGINGMTLVDLAEMLCDWMAATQYGQNGNIQKSIDYNRQRFGISDQLVSILENTACWLRECTASAHRSSPDSKEGENAEAQSKAS